MAAVLIRLPLFNKLFPHDFVLLQPRSAYFPWHVLKPFGYLIPLEFKRKEDRFGLKVIVQVIAMFMTEWTRASVEDGSDSENAFLNARLAVREIPKIGGSSAGMCYVS